MSRWFILSLFAAGLVAAPLLAQDPAKPKPKAEPKAEAPKTGTKPKTQPPKEEPLDEKTVKERASYAIGLQLGGNLSQGIKQDGADVEIDQILKGIKDAFTGAKPAYTDEELDAAYTTFSKALQAKAAANAKDRSDKDKTLADTNKKDGEAFLADNKKKKDVQTTSTGLQFKVMKKGGGKSPQKTDEVRVHYHGTLPDGTVFDSSIKRGEPAQFEVGGVIPGWTEALLKMKVGDKWMLYIPSDLAYGPRRRSPEIGPNQVLVFEVELLEIVGDK